MLYSKYSYVNYFGIKKSCHFEQNGSFFNNEKLVNYVYSEGRGLHNSVPLDWDKMAGGGGGSGLETVGPLHPMIMVHSLLLYKYTSVI